ncbi:pectate lyase-like protein [Paenibacillus taihuensis]|uniref:Pectate lyase-like protein n=1 Tax=Paenibacillus taihuensis TaxID=1156355 RepID=A0A3D9SC59_9BACL|nr:glycosyl hydrolase family 28-related protein [Paenibacillus taihuensis]REE88908.1 pectate lyase-like protein [Paenibacillus taihuensis]
MKVKSFQKSVTSTFLSAIMVMSVGPLTGAAHAGPVASATISVVNYGANGSGSLDDRAAIQAAVDAASPGDTVLLPKGTYYLAGTVNATMSSKIW